MEKVVSSVKQFSESRASDLDLYCQGEIKESIDSIVANRHQIAHGGSPSITIARVGRYFANAKRMVQKLDELLGPS
jgi:hypothetical protein